MANRTPSCLKFRRRVPYLTFTDRRHGLRHGVTTGSFIVAGQLIPVRSYQRIRATSPSLYMQSCASQVPTHGLAIDRNTLISISMGLASQSPVAAFICRVYIRVYVRRSATDGPPSFTEYPFETGEPVFSRRWDWNA